MFHQWATGLQHCYKDAAAVLLTQFADLYDSHRRSPVVFVILEVTAMVHLVDEPLDVRERRQLYAGHVRRRSKVEFSKDVRLDRLYPIRPLHVPLAGATRRTDGTVRLRPPAHRPIIFHGLFADLNRRRAPTVGSVCRLGTTALYRFA